MHAFRLYGPDDPNRWVYEEATTREPGEGEVLIRVSRAGVNFADTHQRENAYLAKFELPFVPGGEVAGVVERGDGELSGGTRA